MQMQLRGDPVGVKFPVIYYFHFVSVAFFNEDVPIVYPGLCDFVIFHKFSALIAKCLRYLIKSSLMKTPSLNWHCVFFLLVDQGAPENC